MNKSFAVRGSRSSFALAGAFATLGVFAPVPGTAPAASAATINFNGYQTGRHINDEYQSQGVTISADNYRAGGPNIAILFDSLRANTPDPDLEFRGAWSAGNIRFESLGKFLIVAENVSDTSPGGGDGFVDNPDDEADGGTLMMKFSTLKTSIGFDLIDVELTPQLDRVEFLLRGVPLTSVTFDKFTTPGPFFEPGVVYADRSANRISEMTIADLGIVPFDEVRWYMPECAAIDNVVFDFNPALVPEPASAALLLGGLAPLTLRRRRM